MYVPPDFPIVDTRLVIGQWRQACGPCSKDRSPIVARRYRRGVFFVTFETPKGRTVIYRATSPSWDNGWICSTASGLPGPMVP